MTKLNYFLNRPVAGPEDEDPVGWWCYDCGADNSSGAGNFRTTIDYGVDYDVECVACGSTDTGDSPPTRDKP